MDPTRLSVVHSLLQFLQIKQCAIQKQIDSNTEDIKKNSENQLKQTTRLETDLKDQLEHNKRLEKGLVDACMQMETLICLQNEQSGIYIL